MYKHSGVICIDGKKKLFERYINANVTDIVYK